MPFLKVRCVFGPNGVGRGAELPVADMRREEESWSGGFVESVPAERAAGELLRYVADSSSRTGDP